LEIRQLLEGLMYKYDTAANIDAGRLHESKMLWTHYSEDILRSIRPNFFTTGNQRLANKAYIWNYVIVL
jgi:hypothetical protein